MGFHPVRIDRERFLVALDGRVDVPGPMQHVGKMQTGVAMPFIQPDRLLEMLPRAVKVVDSPERRSEHDMILDASARDGSGAIEQALRLFHGAELAAHHREPAQSAKVVWPIGEQAAIRLLCRVQDRFSGLRWMRSGGQMSRQRVFVHGATNSLTAFDRRTPAGVEGRTTMTPIVVTPRRPLSEMQERERRVFIFKRGLPSPLATLPIKGNPSAEGSSALGSFVFSGSDARARHNAGSGQVQGDEGTSPPPHHAYRWSKR